MSHSSNASDIEESLEALKRENLELESRLNRIMAETTGDGQSRNGTHQSSDVRDLRPPANVNVPPAPPPRMSAMNPVSNPNLNAISDLHSRRMGEIQSFERQMIQDSGIAQNALTELNRKSLQLETALLKEQSQKDGLQRRLNEMERARERDNQIWQNKCNELRNGQSEKYNQIQQELVQSRNESNQLRVQLQKVQNEKQQISNKAESIFAEYTAVKQSLQSVTELVKSTSQTTAMLRGQNDKLNEQILDYQKQLKQGNNERMSLGNDLSAMNQKVDGLENVLMQLQNKLQQLNVDKQRSQQIQSELNNQNSMLKNKIEHLSLMKEQSELQNKQIQQEVSTLSESNRHLNSTLQSKEHELNQLNQNLNGLRQEYNVLVQCDYPTQIEQIKAKSQHQISNCQTQISYLVEENKALGRSLTNALSRIKQFQTAVSHTDFS